MFVSDINQCKSGKAEYIYLSSSSTKDVLRIGVCKGTTGKRIM